jgi:hypothetical protein
MEDNGMKIISKFDNSNNYIFETQGNKIILEYFCFVLDNVTK